MAAPLPTLLEALDDPRVWKSWFARGGASWDPWKAFLRVLTGEPLSEAEHVLFEACTGRKSPPNGPYQEAWLICGRRAGKSFILATIAVYTAIFRKWGQYLGPGERGTVLILAADRKQARTLLRYAKGLIQGNAALRDLIERETTEELELKNRISLEIATASFRTTRGYTVIAALLDEVAFWRSEESANPDSEIVDAIRPAMATIPGAFLLGASSPYAKRGLLYQQFKRHFGKDH
ncbi:MAG: hypothetical protein JOY71_10170, partial [Acetobacteraceae bacterium]|nr:hypothetical protein [Acetobacteraceae bacterium]